MEEQNPKQTPSKQPTKTEAQKSILSEMVKIQKAVSRLKQRNEKLKERIAALESKG